MYLISSHICSILFSIKSSLFHWTIKGHLARALFLWEMLSPRYFHNRCVTFRKHRKTEVSRLECCGNVVYVVAVSFPFLIQYTLEATFRHLQSFTQDHAMDSALHRATINSSHSGGIHSRLPWMRLIDMEGECILPSPPYPYCAVLSYVLANPELHSVKLYQKWATPLKAPERDPRARKLFCLSRGMTSNKPYLSKARFSKI
jgi:hypothetical protein